MTSSVAVFEAVMRVKSIYMINHDWKLAKKENTKTKEIFNLNLSLKDGLGMPERVLTSFTVCDAYGYFAG